MAIENFGIKFTADTKSLSLDIKQYFESNPVEIKVKLDTADISKSVKKNIESTKDTKFKSGSYYGISDDPNLSAKEKEKEYQKLFKTTSLGYENAIKSSENLTQRLKVLNAQGTISKKEFLDFNTQLTNLNSQLESNTIGIDEYNNGIKSLTKQVQLAGASQMTFTERVKSAIKAMSEWAISATLIYGPIRAIKSMISEVVSLDDAMLELSKVTDLTSEQLELVKDKAFEVGRSVGRTATDTLSAVSTFKRAGYTIVESLDLAKTALVMTNVSDGIDDIAEASSSLISILRGFKLEASDAEHVLDVLNHTSNNFAIDTVNLTEIMKRVSGTLAQTGTSFEELTGMATAAFGTLRNAEMVASGINMISQRMRGMTEDGENSLGLIPKIEEALQKYTYGVVSMYDKETGGLKSTYDVLQELSKVYGQLDDSARAYLNEVIAGNRQNKVLVSIMESWSEVEEVVKATADATGSAMTENEKYLNSISGGLEGLKTAFQELADKTISKDFVKSLITAAEGVLVFTNKLGGLKTIVLGLAGALLVANAAKVATFITSMADTIRNVVSFTIDLVKMTLKTKLYTAEAWKAFFATMSWKNALTLGVAAVGIIAGITAVTMAVSEYTKNVDLNIDSLLEDKDAIDENTESQEALNTSLIEFIKRLREINSLLSDKLTLDKEQNAELQNQKDLQDKLLKVEQARAALAEAQRKKTRVFRAGRGFVYESDYTEIQSAQENLLSAVQDLEEFKYDLLIQKAEDFKDKFDEILNGDTDSIVSSMEELIENFEILFGTEFESYLQSAIDAIEKYKVDLGKEKEELSIITPSETSSTTQNSQSEQKEKWNWGNFLKGLVNPVQGFRNIFGGLYGAEGLFTYANGTNSAGGGLSLVGEEGPELRVLNKGDGIIPSNLTKNLVSLASNPRLASNSNLGNTTNISVGTVEVSGVQDVEGFMTEFQNKLETSGVVSFTV